MKINMIVTDLDQTLLHTDKSLSEYTVSILKRYQSKGIKVAFASARSEKSCERFLGKMEPDAVISNGGALARQKETVLYRSVMAKEVVDAVIRRCMNEPSVGYITVETEKGYYVNHPIDLNNPGWLDYTHAKPMDFHKNLNLDADKVTVQLPDEATAIKMIEGFPEVGVTGFSDGDWYRFAHKSATKWNAIQATAKHFQIDIKNVVSFGDDAIDVEMVEKCGMGIAVANAIDQVIAVADSLCKSNDEDGVAHWLEENLKHIKERRTQNA